MIKKEQQEWFDQLHIRNGKASEVFKLPEYVNVFRGVIDKYSDSAHFIYELLQNADDAGATEVSMQLEKGKFIFSHNGTIRFTVSDPENIVADREAGRLGHINSICYIGFSSKSSADVEVNMQNKIGKFGVGFKAVFQYTSTPEIYDFPFCFRIDDYIIPSIIDNPRYQKTGHTVFVIPFNRKDISQKRAFKEISQKLRNLNYPQLFLNHIQKISWETPSQKNLIVKDLEQEGYSHGIKYALYTLSNSLDNEKKKIKILLLSKIVDIPEQGKHNITIGYYINRGRILTKESRNIHCFFPTNENIGTCYVIHAPFALVDNRQQIKRNNEVNDFLFQSIAKLAADSLLVLRDWKGYDKAKLLDDNIVYLTKYDTMSIEGGYFGFNNIRKFFENNYSRIFNNEAIFLSRNGKYLTKREAWWADKETRELLSENQIERLMRLSCGDSKTYGFVLCSINRTELENSEIGINKFDGIEFAKNITSVFMKEQSNEWLARFYTFVKEKKLVKIYDLNKGNESTAPMRHANIIKVQNGEFLPAYNETDELQVFFIKNKVTNPERSVNISLIESCDSFREILNELGVKAPNQLDQLRIKIDQHKSLSQKENNDLLVSLIRYYYSCTQEFRDIILRIIKDKLSFKAQEINYSHHLMWTKPEEMYDDNSLLKEYYKASGLKGKFFIYRPYYESAIADLGENKFDQFISELDFKIRPSYSRVLTELSGEEWPLRNHPRIEKKEISMIEGLKVVLSNGLKKYFSESLSHYIWDFIVLYSNKYKDFFDNNISNYILYKTCYTQDWGKSSMVNIIRNSVWLFIKGERKSLANGIYKEELIENGYSCDSIIITKLKIESAPNMREAEAILEMSAETRETFALGQDLRNEGFTCIDDVRQMKAELEAYKRKEKEEAIAQKERQARVERRKLESEAFNELPTRKKSSGVQAKDFDAPDNEGARSSKAKSTTSNKNIDEILEGFVEKAKVEREEFELVAQLRDSITQSDKYSYDWFKSLMELEVRSQGAEKATGKKSLYISFERVNAKTKNDRMIILSGPSRYIPMSLEEMDYIPITFVYKNGTEYTIQFESISVKEDSVILIHKVEVIDTIRENINSISYIFTEINEPIELLSEWQSLIYALNFEPDDSVKNNLRKDIEFIFGPPGTGKTTTIAHRIKKIISGCEREMKILVLAPTNKACDVITQKLLDVSYDDDTWIWRFEKTDDPYLEEQEVVYKRSCKVSDQRKVCVISTIARYAFDGFEDGLLRNLEWDYVFIDEASMIPLYQIVPPLYNPRSKRIIVSGDPFQIEPIVNIDLWKGENIYTMINLNNFVKPTTEPVQFKVTTLMTQYRSIPKIGELFSSYLYGGKLQHNRTESQHRVLEMGIKESPLNIISFPVGEESIFDLKRLSGSNIQVYSVIFTIEFLKYITRNLNDNHKKDAKSIKIGIISPYAAEIQTIEKIYNQSCPFYDNIDVIFGSAHGFQGDQCDIIIAVINPPASGLKRAADMTFINNKNILNVAISRASDYLFLLIPEKDYENFNSLYEIKKLGRKMNKLGSEIYSSDMVENILFSEAMHIERITYVTSHKMTNVFNNPFTPYEIRIDENAIDVQINDL